MTHDGKFIVTEYSFGKFLAPIAVEAEDGPSAICKALGILVLPFGYVHEGDHMDCHAQFSSHGKTGAHAHRA